MSIPLSEAIALGVVQGVTEFLPVSSDGHLALAQMFFGHEADPSLALFLHAGTLAATLLVLRKRAWGALEEGLRGLARPSLWRETPGGRDAVAVVLATLPTAAIGLALRRSVEGWSVSPAVIGAGLLASAAAVGSTRWVPRLSRSLRFPDVERDVPTAVGALLIGAAQGIAVLPGLSRSAATLAALLWLGVRAERAFELSFLMSIPAVAGAMLLEGGAALRAIDDPSALVVATTAAFVIGVVALEAMRRVLAGGKLPLFAVYLGPVAIATLAWGYARP